MFYSIGEVIQKANISRRTLHYYDEIGLLKPTISKDNGYRFYDEESIVKLQTILSLKSMNYSLEEIKELFDEGPSSFDTWSTEDSWIPLLETQIKKASIKIGDLKKKQFILRSVLHTILLSGQRKNEHIFQLINRIDSPHFVNDEIPATFPKNVFTDEEIEVLEQLPLIGSDDARMTTAIKLIEQTRISMRTGMEREEIQQLAEQWRDCISSWFNGDVELQIKYFQFIDTANKEQPVIFGIDDEVVQYIDCIMNDTSQNAAKGTIT